MTPLSRERVTEIVLRAITDSLLLTGRPAPKKIPMTTRVIGKVEGFDSPMGVDVTVDLELHFGIELPHNVFVKNVNGRPRARTLAEVVDVLSRMLEGKES